MHNEEIQAKRRYIFCVSIWSLVTLCRKYCAVSSGWLAAWRSLLGAVMLLAILLIRREKLDARAMRKKAAPLFLSGIFLGLNWIALLEALMLIPVSIAVILYNLAPIFVIAASPLLLKEKVTARGIGCVALALLGVVLTTGIVGESSFSLFAEANGMRIWNRTAVLGVILAILGAVFYAAMILTNKMITGVTGKERTLVQFIGSFAATALYAVLREPWEPGQYDARSVWMLLIIGLLLTGAVYYVYFSSLHLVKPQTIAVWSYANPLLSVLIGIVCFHEELTVWIVLGSILILGATLVNENPFANRESKGV